MVKRFCGSLACPSTTGNIDEAGDAAAIKARVMAAKAISCEIRRADCVSLMWIICPLKEIAISGLWYLGCEHPGDVYAPHDGDIIEFLGVPDEACEGVGACGIAGNAGMQADRHHPSCVIAIVAQPVERRLRGFEKVFRA